MVDEAVTRCGAIDILVNNAGANVRKAVVDLEVEEWDLIINTNLKGYFLVARAVGKEMMKQMRGKVINMASILGAVGLPHQLAYSSSKGGIIMMTKIMALEIGRVPYPGQCHCAHLFRNPSCRCGP